MIKNTNKADRKMIKKSFNNKQSNEIRPQVSSDQIVFPPSAMDHLPKIRRVVLCGPYIVPCKVIKYL